MLDDAINPIRHAKRIAAGRLIVVALRLALLQRHRADLIQTSGVKTFNETFREPASAGERAILAVTFQKFLERHVGIAKTLESLEYPLDFSPEILRLLKGFAFQKKVVAVHQ